MTDRRLLTILFADVEGSTALHSAKGDVEAEEILAPATSWSAIRLREALGDSAPELARVVPELRQLFPEIPPPVELPPDQQRRYTFNSIREYAIRAARRSTSSRTCTGRTRALSSSSSTWPSGCRPRPCLVIGTYRDPPIEVSKVLADSLAGLVRRRQARLVTLSATPRPRSPSCSAR